MRVPEAVRALPAGHTLTCREGEITIDRYWRFRPASGRFSSRRAAIDQVRLRKGTNKPIRIEIEMSNSAGVFQVDELLKRKLRNSSIAPYVQVVARIEGETEKRLLEFYTI